MHIQTHNIAGHTNSNKSANQVSNIQITDLTPYCIVRLFKYLNTIDMLKFTLIFNQYSDIVADYIEEDRLDLNQLMREFNAEEMKGILRNFHPFIREMKITFTEEFKQVEMCKLVAKYCHNIDDLTISEMNWRHLKSIEKIFKAQKHLTVLTVLHWDKDKTLCQLVADKLPKLETLVVAFQYNYCGGPYTRKLRHFVEFRKFDCEKFKKEYFEGIMDVGRLKKLEVSLSDNLDEVAFRLMPLSVYAERELKRSTSFESLDTVDNEAKKLRQLRFINIDWMDVAITLHKM